MRRFLADESTLQTAGMTERGLFPPCPAEAHLKHGSGQHSNPLPRFRAQTFLSPRAGEMPRKTENFCGGEGTCENND